MPDADDVERVARILWEYDPSGGLGGTPSWADLPNFVPVGEKRMNQYRAFAAELLESGEITFPKPEPPRSTLWKIGEALRTGGFSLISRRNHE